MEHDDADYSMALIPRLRMAQTGPSLPHQNSRIKTNETFTVDFRNEHEKLGQDCRISSQGLANGAPIDSVVAVRSGPVRSVRSEKSMKNERRVWSPKVWKVIHIVGNRLSIKTPLKRLQVPGRRQYWNMSVSSLEDHHREVSVVSAQRCGLFALRIKRERYHL